MKGSHQIIVQNNRVQYKFTINRNITILRGRSATGKTSLINMINQYVTDGKDSGISVSCDKKVYVLTQLNWELILSTLNDTIIFIDEGVPFVKSDDFARKVKSSSNYFVISVRDSLPNLPYSVDEIYELHNSTKKYGSIKRLYTNFKKIYFNNEFVYTDVHKPELVIVEDSNSGYQFFNAYFSERKIECISAESKSKIYTEILKQANDKKILVIADGAAFGSEIERIIKLKYVFDLTIFLPESFEWLILSSGIFNKIEINSILNKPSDYIESEKYFSWERFFTTYLIEQTKQTYLQYKKSELNKAYLQIKEKELILKTLPEELKQ